MQQNVLVPDCYNDNHDSNIVFICSDMYHFASSSDGSVVSMELESGN